MVTPGETPVDFDFDPLVAAEVLEWMAELAGGRREEGTILESNAPVVRAGAALLSDARGWLDVHRTFAGDAILRTVAQGQSVSLGSLIVALRETAEELVHVRELAERRVLRGSLADAALPR